MAASKEDLTEQLGLAKQVAAQIERMAAAAEKLETSYDNQVALIEKIAATFGKVDTSGATGGLDTLNKALDDSSKKMEDTGKLTSSTFTSMSKKIEEAGKNIGQKFPKSVLVATGAIKGFVTGFTNIIALGKGIISFTTGVVDGLANITASIISIPFKMFEGLVDMAAKSAGGSNELMQALEELRKQFGAFSGPTNKAIIDTSKELKGFSDTGLSAYRVFGNMAERLKYMGEMAKEMGTSFNLIRKEMEDNGGAILAYRKGLGLTAEAMKAIAQRSDMMGEKSGDTLNDMTKYSYAFGKALNLDAKVISREMGEAMKDMAHFGTTSQKVLAENVAQAHQFGLELKDVAGELDKYTTYEDAADNVSKLSQAFGTNISAMDLMKASAEGDTGKMTEIFRSAFKEVGTDGEHLNNIQRKLIRDTTGWSDAAIGANLATKNQGKSLKDLQTIGDKAEKKTLSQADAMHQLADAIERLTPQGPGLEGGFWAMFLKGVKNGIMSSKEFYGMMLNIQRALREVYQVGVKLGRDLVKIVPGFQDILGGLKEFFQPGKFAKMFQNISDSVRRYFDPNSTDAGSIPALIKGLHKSITDMFSAEGSSGKRILDGFKKLFGMMSKFAAGAIDYMSDQITSGIKYVTKLLDGSEKLSGPGGAGGALGFLGDLLDPIIESLKKAYKQIKPVLWGLFKQLASMAMDWVKENKTLLGEIGLGIFGYIFATTLVGSAAGLMSKVLLDAGAGLLSGVASAGFKKIGADVLSNMFASTESKGVTAAVNNAITSAFGGGKTGGLAGEFVEKSSTGLLSKMGGMADTFAKSIGASGAGSALGLAAGIAVAAYIGVEGKKLIDETFEKGKKADTNLRGAEMEAYQATTARTPMEKKLLEVKKLQDTIEEQQKALNDKTFGQKALNWIAGTDIAADQAADALAQSKRTLATLMEQTKDAQKLSTTGIDAVRAKAEAAAKDNQKFFGATSLEDAKGKLDTLEEFSKKFKGKNFDLQKMMDDLRAKFKDVNFEIITPIQAGSLGVGGDEIQKLDGYFNALKDTVSIIKQVPDAKNLNLNAITDLSKKLDGVSFQVVDTTKLTYIKDSVDGLQKVSGFMSALIDTVKSIQAVGNTGGVGYSVKVVNSTINDVANMLTSTSAKVGAQLPALAAAQDNYTKLVQVIKGDGKGGITGALSAVTDMVSSANALSSALANGDLNKIDIKTKLENVARSVGLGGKASYTVQNAGVSITVNMTVEINAADMEKAIVLRESSIIADRINFATSNPTQAGDTTIKSGQVPPAIKNAP